MKRIIFLVIVCALSCNAVKAQQNPVSEEKSDTTAVFDHAVHDFGTVSESGGIVECTFTLTNTGDNPLVITKVTTSCGCTASDWTREPVGAGKKGLVKASFDPKGHKGEVTKLLTVFTNGNPSRISLKIKGNVE